MNTPSANGPIQRRSVRVLVTIPLLISGRKSDGTRFDGTAETIIVNKHGAKIRTQETLTCGLEIRIAILSPYRWQMAQVVRQEAEGEFGIELTQAENFWGVYLPPDDWTTEQNQESASPPESSSPALTSDNSQELPNAKIQVNPPIVKVETERLGPANVESCLRVSRDGSLAVIRGFSAAHVPFQEKGLLVPVDPYHANFSVLPLVEPGARVRVVVLPNERVVNAVVARLSRVREHGRWRLVLKFTTSIDISEETEPPKPTEG